MIRNNVAKAPSYEACNPQVLAASTFASSVSDRRGEAEDGEAGTGSRAVRGRRSCRSCLGSGGPRARSRRFTGAATVVGGVFPGFERFRRPADQPVPAACPLLRRRGSRMEGNGFLYPRRVGAGSLPAPARGVGRLPSVETREESSRCSSNLGSKG
jgi:hypothetical protein